MLPSETEYNQRERQIGKLAYTWRRSSLSILPAYRPDRAGAQPRLLGCLCGAVSAALAALSALSSRRPPGLMRQYLCSAARSWLYWSSRLRSIVLVVSSAALLIGNHAVHAWCCRPH